MTLIILKFGDNISFEFVLCHFFNMQKWMKYTIIISGAVVLLIIIIIIYTVVKNKKSKKNAKRLERPKSLNPENIKFSDNSSGEVFYYNRTNDFQFKNPKV